MKFISLLVALLLEQVRPLRPSNRVHLSFVRYVKVLERHFNAGQYRHGVIGWLLAVAPVAVLTGLVYYYLLRAGPVLAMAWSVVVLYLTMGFRQFSHYFTEISQCLRSGNLAAARELLGKWRGESATELSASEIARLAIEQGLLSSYRHVFGVVAWFAVLGPVGAVLYRTASLLNDNWGTRRDAEFGEFGGPAATVFHWMDWVPLRLTAVSFAVVGDFEDAIYCWRAQAAGWPNYAHGIILASGAGALGVRLGDALHQYGGVRYRPELGTGDEADVEHMQSTAGLIWRALVLWMFVLLIVTIAHSLG